MDRSRASARGGLRAGPPRAVARQRLVALAVGGAAVVGGVVAVWVTLPADFLRYPAWLAAQKADFVIGPVLTGLYWMRRRPQSPFGPMLIAWGASARSTSSSRPATAGCSRSACSGRRSADWPRTPHPGVPDRAAGPARDVSSPARGRALLVDPLVCPGRRDRLPAAVPAQRARLHVEPGAGARPVRGVQLRGRVVSRRGGPSLRHRLAAAEAGAGHRHARRPAVPVCEILYQSLTIMGADGGTAS